MTIAALAALTLVSTPTQATASTGWRASASTCERTWTQVQHAKYARAVYGRSQASKKARARLVKMRKCMFSAQARTNARRLVRRLRKRYKLKRLGNRGLGQMLAAKRGWTGREWVCLLHLWNRESGWGHLVSNHGGSGAYGIPQALPGSKMGSAGADWQTNPATQIKWGLKYIAGRYGTPCEANSHQLSANWY